MRSAVSSPASPVWSCSRLKVSPFLNVQDDFSTHCNVFPLVEDFVILIITGVYYRQDCREAANCRYCFYSQAKKSGFSPRGDSLHRFRSNFAGPTGTWVRLAVQNFTSIGADGWEIGPKKYQKFPLFGTDSPRRGDSLDRFPEVLGAFIRLTILNDARMSGQTQLVE